MSRALAWFLTLLLSVAARPALGQGLGAFVSPGELAAAHAELSGLTQCTSCHEAGRGVSATRCLACHEEIAADVAAKRGLHATLGGRCETCHPDHRGRDFDMARLDPHRFDHALTGFRLAGAHADADCADCHTDAESWRGLKSDCAACHDVEHGQSASTRGLLSRCASCHDTTAWDALPLPTAVFRHDDPRHADYPLEGAHADVACAACHPDWRFVPVEHDACADCHRDPHAGRLGPVCTNCHPTPASWAVSRFDHDRTDFPLEGLHARVACSGCHGADTTRPVRHTTCASCHKDPHGGQFAPRACTACHDVRTAGFRLPDFDHATTGSPLRGAHREVPCASCHGAGPGATWAGLEAAACASCHEDPHDARFAPAPCASCHDETGWQVASFDHDQTAFPLRDAHAAVACAACHADGLKDVAFASCRDCHEDPHGPGLDAASCTSCHDAVAWRPVRFDHAQTAWPLDGAHARAPCAACHDAPDFRGETTACADCHDRPPGHFPGPCLDCHQTSAWAPATLGSLGHAVTGFILHGRHAQLACASCHLPGAPAGAAGSRCVDCHQAEDPHRHLLGDTCEDCHDPTTWHRAAFRHSQTGWPLRGAHRLAWCDDCHATGYAGTPRDCWRCHEAQATPDVAAHQTPDARDCGLCHQPFTWSPTAWPH